MSRCIAPDKNSPYRCLFGPVPSRRLGLSLGIDLFPRKLCSFNCLYCECGSTREMVLERGEWVSFADVESELRRFFPHDLDHVTFSGKGEPTLYSRLGELIGLVRALSPTPIAVITNSSLIMREDVRAELCLADRVVPSLDAVSPEVMRRINRSHPGVSAEEMIQGLVHFREDFSGRMDLEILFCRGINDAPRELALLRGAIEKIRPDTVQLNTVDRPPAVESARALSFEELEKIRLFFDMDKVEVIGAFPPKKPPSSFSDGREQVLSLVLRRGVEENDLLKTLALPRDEAMDLLDRLCGEGKIQKMLFEGRTHYGKPQES